MIYADLVALLNFLVDFLLILAANRLSGFSPGWGRALFAAVIGGIYGGACLLPQFRFLGNLAWRCISLVFIIVAAFGWNRSAISRGCIFVLLSMALGGIASGIGAESTAVLILAALSLWLLCAAGFRGGIGNREYVPVTLRWKEREVNIIALKDTGNTLSDPVTGEHVLVAGADVAGKLLGLSEYQLLHPLETLSSGSFPGLRLIPYHAVGQPGSMMLAARFVDATIGNVKVQPLVAFAPQVLAKGEIYQMLTGGAI